ncbi:hypothetical protein [Pararobbsia alpina]|nr:hypothetical protein [Pararobbsia alpina]
MWQAARQPVSGVDEPRADWIEDATHELGQADSRLADLRKALDAAYPKDADEKERWRAAGHFHRINTISLSIALAIKDTRALLAANTSAAPAVKGCLTPEHAAIPDTLLVDLFYAAQGDITQFRIKARGLLAVNTSTAALTDEQIIALNAGEVFFSETPTRFPEAGHGTQYHAGAPGLIKFARTVLAANAQAPVALTRDEILAQWLAYPISEKNAYEDVADFVLGLLTAAPAHSPTGAPQ